MRTRRRRSAMWALLVIVGSVLPLAWWLSTSRAQTASHPGELAQPSRRPIRITMEALHNHGGGTAWLAVHAARGRSGGRA